MTVKSFVCLCLIASVVSLLPSAHAQTYSVIHTFTGPDGSQPEAGVTLRAGILYGTTRFASSWGNVYSLTRFEDNWFLSNLFIFSGQSVEPLSRPVFGPDGHLYGTTFLNSGSVFKLTPPIPICRTAKCFWTYDEIDHFQDLQNPGYGDLAFDSQGNIYGTVEFSLDPPQLGAVYQLSHVGSDWVSTPIYRFQPRPDTGQTDSGVILDTNGNVFGTAPSGGAQGKGAIYEVKHVTGVGWQESIIYSFNGSSDGWGPTGITFDTFGNLFGVTAASGAGNGGTVFELSPAGDTWTFKLLYSFTDPGNCHGQGGPRRPLTVDAAGNLYGTTGCDGAYGHGSVFKLTKSGNSWVFSSLYDFMGAADGADPSSTVTIDTDGTLYGTASSGGSQNSNGVVWMIKP
jgi:uncharacterized repeat protein (TIGR03803 family)